MSCDVSISTQCASVALSALLLGTHITILPAAPLPVRPVSDMPPADALHSPLPGPRPLPGGLTEPTTHIAAVSHGAQLRTYPMLSVNDAHTAQLLREIHRTAGVLNRLKARRSRRAAHSTHVQAYYGALLAYGRHAYAQEEYRESCQAFLMLLNHLATLPAAQSETIDSTYVHRAEIGAKNAANAWAAALKGDTTLLTKDATTDPQASDQGATASCNSGNNQEPPKPVKETTHAALGAPIYSVNPNNLNVFLTDIPLAYQPLKGPPVEIKLVYSATRTTTGCLGPKWHCSLDSWLSVEGRRATFVAPEQHALSNVIPGLVTNVRVVTTSGRLDTYTYARYETGTGGLFRIMCTTADADSRHAGSPGRACELALDVSASKQNSVVQWHVLAAHATMADGLVYSYMGGVPASRANLVSITDRNGNSLQYLRGTDNSVQRIVDACGRESICYYSGPYLLAVQDPAGRRAEFSYAVNGVLDTVQDAAGFISAFSYVPDGIGSYVVYHRDDSRYVHQKCFQYTRTSGLITRVIVRDFNGDNTPGTFEVYQWAPGLFYTQNKNMYAHKYEQTKQRYCDHWAVKTDYDHEVTDEDFYLATATETMSSETSTTIRRTRYAAPSRTDPPAAAVSCADYDARGNLTRFVDPNQSAWRYEYDAMGNLIRAITPDNATNTYEYDIRGNLVRTIAPDGVWTRAYTYNAYGQLTKVTALVRKELPLGGMVEPGVPGVQTNRDVFLTTPAPAAQSTTGGWPPGGDTTQPPAGPGPGSGDPGTERAICATLLSIAYDPGDTALRLTYPSGEKRSYMLDAAGQVTSVYSKAKDTPDAALLHSLAYDGLGRVTNIAYPDGTSVARPMNLRGPASITDRDGKTTVFAYNENFQPASITRPDGATVEFGYAGWRLRALKNARGNPGDSSYTSVFDYDGGRLTGLQYPACNPQSYAYDWPGTLTAVTNENEQIICYAHDAAGRVTNIEVAANAALPPVFHAAFAYDAAGRLTNLVDRTGAHSYRYDLRGQLVSDAFAASPGSALSYTLTYAYDNLGQRTNMTVAPTEIHGHPIPARSFAYEYNYAIMTLKSVTDMRMTPGQKTVQYAYDANGRLQTTSYANGARQEYAHDAESRLTNLAVRGAGGTVLEQQALVYTAGGVLTGICAAAHTACFGYDVLNQISNETYHMAGGTNATRVYHYDANGNRTREDRAEGAAAVARFYEPATPDDRITSHTENGVTTSYAYDACGNRTNATSGTMTYVYDAFGRMTAVSNSTLLASYTYDALGRKVARRTTDTDPHYDQHYIYDGLDPVCIVDDHWGPGPQVTWLLRGHGVAPGIGSIAAQQVTHPTLDGGDGLSTLHYYHPNHRGDTLFLTDANGQQAAAFVYDAFGRLLAPSGIWPPASGIWFGFSGKEWDAEAGLYYFGFRWYDPNTGTWTTKDPLGFGAGDENVYRAMANNAVYVVDPYGLLWAEFLDEINPANSCGTFRRQLRSIGQFYTGDWRAAAENSNQQILDEADSPSWAYWAHYGMLGASAAASLAAGGLMMAEWMGISSIGSAQVGWKGGEITFTQIGKTTPDWRINPFKLHYHRRPGIGKHRPWEGGW